MQDTYSQSGMPTIVANIPWKSQNLCTKLHNMVRYQTQQQQHQEQQQQQQQYTTSEIQRQQQMINGTRITKDGSFLSWIVAA